MIRTVFWLALRGGRTDRTRIALTATVSALAVVALLCAATVAAIGPGDGPYTSELLSQSGLHQGVVIAFALLAVPVLVLVGQCSRVGAPARDRRLAAYRLAGATPRQVSRVAVAESVLASALGTVLGIGVFLAGRWLLDGPTTVVAPYIEERVIDRTAEGYTIHFAERVGVAHQLPTDVPPPWWALLTVAVGLPLGVAVFSRLALRRVVVSPFGVVRQVTNRPPRVLPLVLFVAGTGVLVVFSAVSSVTSLADEPAWRTLAVVGPAFLACAAGLIVGTASVSAEIGRFVATRTSSPALLIASRRLVAVPFAASRAHAVVLLAVVIGGATQGVRNHILAITDPADRLYLDALNLVNLALLVGLVLAAAGVLVHTAERAVSGRQGLASLAATGVPRSVLARGLVWESLLPLLPTVVLGASAGVLAVRGMFGTTHSEDTSTRRSGQRFEVLPVPVPWVEVAVLVGGAIGVTVLMAALGLSFVRRSTDPSELRTTA